MKKFTVLLIVIVLLLTGCQSEPVTITLDRENNTLSDGTYTYSYVEQEIGSTHTITITYPDGGRYEWTEMIEGTYADATYDASLYADGEQMVNMILGNVIIGEPQQTRREVSAEGIVVAILLLCLGLWETACPEQAAYAGHGWMFKDAEPSDLAIGLHRAGGILALIAAVIVGIAAIAGF